MATTSTQLVRRSDRFVNKICRIIANSPDATEFGRKALIWLIKHSENLSKFVYTKTIDQQLGQEMAHGVHDMNAGETRLSENLPKDLYFFGCCNDRDADRNIIWRIYFCFTLGTLGQGSMKQAELIPFNADEINAINLSVYQ